ncbi:M14 family zinc carboxypeptidase [Pedobacter sp.]|uniref:M14 family zinc carboxypeptidase n=1 Tax=Pedobacter sp. TaxID=1411316 RepID=UPI003D7F6C0A
MQALTYLEEYHSFKEAALNSRFLKHKTIQQLIKKLPEAFEQRCIGQSHEGRDINLIQWGNGSIKVFLWSQMHGDEATGTMALFDLFNFLQLPQFQEISSLLAKSCTLYLLPMVNPDGAERFVRRNAQQIDINRDFNHQVSPEARLLKNTRAEINPHFGFNLHDQSTLWSVKKTGKPATLSYLAPAFDEALSVNEVRQNAMLVIAQMYKYLNPLLPQQIGLFDDEYEARAFGDNFQAAGTSTILIEAGGMFGDEEKQEIRKYFFLSILSGLYAISTRNYVEEPLQHYFSIPKNNKEIFHILIKNLLHQDIRVSIGLSYEEEPAEQGYATVKTYTIKDIGDLDHLGAYHIYKEETLQIEGPIDIYQPANFTLKKDNMILLSFKNGILQSKL